MDIYSCSVPLSAQIELMSIMGASMLAFLLIFGKAHGENIPNWLILASLVLLGFVGWYVN